MSFPAVSNNKLNIESNNIPDLEGITVSLLVSNNNCLAQEPLVFQANFHEDWTTILKYNVVLGIIMPNTTLRYIPLIPCQTSCFAKYKTMLVPSDIGDYQYFLQLEDQQQHFLRTKKQTFAVQSHSDELWTHGPLYTEIYPNLFIGNAMASAIALQLGFTAVLNVADNIELVFPGGFHYHKVYIQDGSHIPIPQEQIAECVTWLDDQLRQGNKTLVHCRAGIGRSGSIAVAYVYYKTPQWSYEQIVNDIAARKPDIFPHIRLRQSLEQLYPIPSRPRIDTEIESVLCKIPQKLKIKMGEPFSFQLQINYSMSKRNEQGQEIICSPTKNEEAFQPHVYAWLRTNLNNPGNQYIEFAMQQSQKDIWQIAITSQQAGCFWATMSASNFKEAPDNLRHWMRWNIELEVENPGE